MYNFIIDSLSRLFTYRNYGRSLEQYIVANHPKDIYDIERLTEEWQRANSRRWLYV